MLMTYALLFVAICLTVTGEVLLKAGMNEVGEFSFTPAAMFETFTHWRIVAGFALIFGGALFWLYVISRFDLSYAYPLLALSYIAILIPSWLVLGEQITINKIVGALIIVCGVIVLTWRTA
jgi:multidrug transporter EmrE-like cation transporter